jgi:hypothetical protein
MPQRRYDVPWSWETLTLVQALRPIAVFLDIKQLPAHFPKAKRLHVALGDNLPRLREWFRAFYHKPRNGGSNGGIGITTAGCRPDRAPQKAGVNYVLLNPVFDEGSQMELLCKDVLPRV